VDRSFFSRANKYKNFLFSRDVRDKLSGGREGGLCLTLLEYIFFYEIEFLLSLFLNIKFFMIIHILRVKISLTQNKIYTVITLHKNKL